MNAVIKEDIASAATRLFSKLIAQGYRITEVYDYRFADGTIWNYRARLDHATAPKIVRPMKWNGHHFDLGEPPIPGDGKPLFMSPQIADADATRPVFVVEGETCVAAMTKRGLLAVTSGSATSAPAANWSVLRGRRVIIWPDNDEAGTGYADNVEEKLAQLGTTCDRIDATRLGLNEKGDCVDYFALHPNASESEVLALAKVEKHSQDSQIRSAPEPLRRPVPAPEPYPQEELGPILAAACASVCRVIQAPAAICGASLLAAASLAAQGLADVEIDGRVCPLSLWTLTIADSGQRKSAVDSEAMRAAREYEKSIMADFREKEATHSFAVDEWNARRDSVKSEARARKGDGLANALQKLGPEPIAPPRPLLIVADFTAEGLAKILKDGLPSIGAFTDEAALVFGGHGMTKETTSRTAGTLCKLWDNGTLDRVRSQDGATKLYGRRLAMHLMAQPVIAERALSDDVLAGQGFLARCLLAWPDSTAGHRLYRAESLRDDAAMIRYTATLARLHAEPMPIAFGQVNELEPRRLRLSPAAFDAWREFHNEIEAAMCPGGRYALVQPWASKTPEQAIRIAGVLTLVESKDAATIDAATIDRATEIATWHLNEAARLAGTAELSQETRDAEALLDWCHSTDRALLHSGDALRKGPSRIRERNRFLRAMDLLDDAGWSVRLDNGIEIDGSHRRNAWRIAPRSEAR